MPQADYGLLQPSVKLNTPFENLSTVLQLRNQQENARGLAEQRQAIAEQRRALTEKTQQENADRAGAGDAIRAGGGVRETTLALARANAPNSVPGLTEFFDKSDKSKADIDALEQKLNDARMDHIGQTAAEVLTHGVQSLPTALAWHAEQFPKDAEATAALGEKLKGMAPADQTAYLERIRDAAPSAQSARQKAVERGPVKVSPGETVLGPDNKPVYTAPEKVAISPALREFQDAQGQGYKGTFEQYQTADANRKRPVVNVSGMAGMYNQTDPKAIAEGIRRGEMPPDISQYGRPVQGAVASQLTIPGPNGERFNLADAQRTWAAQKRLNSTMNGAQQVRIDQSIKSGLAMYDKVDELADQWDGKGWGPLSRANLQAATQGAKGPEAAKIAIQLQGQIAQLTSDVATLEQGGMTPTNEARAVAEKSMQAWWGNKTIKAMTAQGRANMKIRDLARTDQGAFVGGNTGGNVITGAAPQTPAAAGETLEHRVWRVGGKVGAEPK